jgi:hypothetical protein
MTVDPEIDAALRRLGSAEPAPGLERRITQHLQNPRNRFTFSGFSSRPGSSSRPMTRVIAACALAASVAFSAVAVNPTLRSLVFHGHSASQQAPATNTPRVVAPAAGGFGTASAVHVPVEPVPVEPTPVNQGRGRSRSGRTVLPTGSLAPLPRGVAPRAPLSVAPGATH